MNSTQEQPNNNTKKGSIRIFIDKIMANYAQGDELVCKVIESRLLLNGIHPTEYSNDTPDNSQILLKLSHIEKELAKVFA
ncbi:hypothetical protein [Bernardetia sp.]|uniref:hypothetical protein n=1 Tax=Bernardetia sp. TaxID=1937974 RepID=UPI0025C43F32|nr:hypothetical protein [Bernardetia sp.]